MTTTSFTGLNIVEGTDIVNPLTQLNPNFTKIDDDEFFIFNRAISNCAYSYSGTVHALTREARYGKRATMGLIKFKATNAWSDGDTMTVDGSAVSVKVSSGENAAAGAFAAGLEILALYTTGTVILLTSNNPAIPTASDVTTTGGNSVQDELDSLGGVIRIFESGDYAAGATWVLPQEALDYIATGKAFIIEADVFWGGTYSSARVTKVITRGFGGHTACILNRSDPQIGMLRINNTSFDAYGYDLEYAPIMHNLYMFPLGTN